MFTQPFMLAGLFDLYFKKKKKKKKPVQKEAFFWICLKKLRWQLLGMSLGFRRGLCSAPGPVGGRNSPVDLGTGWGRDPPLALQSIFSSDRHPASAQSRAACGIYSFPF